MGLNRWSFSQRAFYPYASGGMKYSNRRSKLKEPGSDTMVKGISVINTRTET